MTPLAIVLARCNQSVTVVTVTSAADRSTVARFSYIQAEDICQPYYMKLAAIKYLWYFRDKYIQVSRQGLSF